MSEEIILSITQARKKIFEVAEQVSAGEDYILTERGSAKVVMISAKKYAQWKKTIQILNKVPELADEMLSREENIKMKNYIRLEKAIEDEGFIVSEKTKSHYVPSSSF